MLVVDDEELQKEVVRIISSKLDEINSLELDLQKISDTRAI